MVRDISHIDNYPQTDYNFIKRLVGRIFYEALKNRKSFSGFLARLSVGVAGLCRRLLPYLL